MPRFLFTPRWILFHLVVAAGIAAMVWLAFWQLRRLDERQEFNAVVEARTEEPPVPLDKLLAETGDPSSLQWRRVTVTGTWGDGQVLVFNRSQDGLAGDNLVAPLVGDDGTVVLVNRGFVPVGASTAEASGRATIVATVRTSQQRTRGGLTDSTQAGEPITEVRRIDVAQLAPQFGGAAVAPVYLDLISADPALTANDPRPVPGPELSNGPHLSYAVQWMIFACCVALGWVLAVRRSLGNHRREQTHDRQRRADVAAADNAHDGIDVTS